MENLHRDLLKDRQGKKGNEEELRSEQQVSEDRWEEREQRAENLHSNLSKERWEGRKRARAEIRVTGL